jgi:hypothetical protein
MTLTSKHLSVYLVTFDDTCWVNICFILKLIPIYVEQSNDTDSYNGYISPSVWYVSGGQISATYRDMGFSSCQSNQATGELSRLGSTAFSWVSRVSQYLQCATLIHMLQTAAQQAYNHLEQSLRFPKVDIRDSGLSTHESTQSATIYYR